MIESAWAFADRLRDDATDAEHHLKDHLAAPLIEARDAAVANQVLDAFEARVRELFNGNTIHWRQVLPILFREEKAKYAPKGGG